MNRLSVANISAWRRWFSSASSAGPESSMSENRGRMRRCSNGKSNSVASIWLVSSIATLSTKSNSSPIGSSSRIVAARERISGSSSCSDGVEKIGATALRWASWRGGSSAMKLARSSAQASRRSRSSGGSKRVMPPYSCDEESRADVALAGDDVGVAGHRPVGPVLAVGRVVHRILGAQPLEPGPQGVRGEVLDRVHLELVQRRRVGLRPRLVRLASSRRRPSLNLLGRPDTAGRHAPHALAPPSQIAVKVAAA